MTFLSFLENIRVFPRRWPLFGNIESRRSTFQRQTCSFAQRSGTIMGQFRIHWAAWMKLKPRRIPLPFSSFSFLGPPRTRQSRLFPSFRGFRRPTELAGKKSPRGAEISESERTKIKWQPLDTFLLLRLSLASTRLLWTTAFPHRYLRQTDPLLLSTMTDHRLGCQIDFVLCILAILVSLFSLVTFDLGEDCFGRRFIHWSVTSW